jgi:hypothetical protein
MGITARLSGMPPLAVSSNPIVRITVGHGKPKVGAAG